MATKGQRIEASLREQLERKGADKYHFEKLIEDYCQLYEIKELLQRDINETGTVIETFNSRGQRISKPNPAIAERLKVSAQMLKILSTLEISPDSNIGGDEEDEL